MSPETNPLAEFRRLINRRARQFPTLWEASKQLIEKSAFPSTDARLLRRSQEKDPPATIKESLRTVFGQKQAQRVQDLDGKSLKALTGFPPAKALRALCVFFELIARPGSQWPVPMMSSEEIEQRIRHTANPFDLLRYTEVASVLDLGAGDLSFASELVDLYVPEMQRQNRQLILHCLDRLDPHSKLGGPLHPEQDRLRMLQEKVGSTFAFFANQDMFDLRNLDEQGKLVPRYTIRHLLGASHTDLRIRTSEAVPISHCRGSSSHQGVLPTHSIPRRVCARSPTWRPCPPLPALEI